MINNIVIIIIILNFIILLCSISIKPYNKTGYCLRYFNILNATSSFLSIILAYYSIPNNFLYYFVIWSEPIIILMFYAQFINILRMYYKIVLILIYILFALILIFLESNMKIASISRFFESILVVILALIYFSNELIRPKIRAVYKSSDFWFSVGLLFYFGGASLIILISNRYMIKSAVFSNIWDIHNVIFILLYCFILYAFVCYRKETKV